MKNSPLQLRRYFVDEINCTANKDFDPEKDFEATDEQFSVETKITRLEQSEDEEAGSWMIEMAIRQQAGPGQNFPYEFKLGMVGFFTCGNSLPNNWEPEYFVKINGSSLLYGAAREIIRATTARGPYSDLIVPTLSFYEPRSKPEGAEPEK